MADDDNSVKEFGASFKGFLDQMARSAPKEEPFFLTKIRGHFGVEPAQLPTLQERLELADQANLQVALDDYVTGRAHELMGVHQGHSFGDLTLAHLVAGADSGLMGSNSASPGPLQYMNVTLGNEQVLACVKSGLYLIRDGEEPLAVLVTAADEMAYREKLVLEVMARERSLAEAFLGTVRRTMRAKNVFRGHIVSLEQDRAAGVRIKFHRLPKITRDDIILPGDLLDRIERETIHFAKASEALAKAGQHLRRGLLLHGPPGTGKTLTAKYLSSQMSDHTILLLTGRSLGLIERSCTLARMLQPSIMILEDVDLIAEERTHQNCATPILFELLNQMDGLGEDARILFLLTTNRPDLLEPALAARPGRVDQALEVPLPDADCRRRLFELYARGLKLELEHRDQWIQRTERASAAFIRELVRKSALLAADGQSEITIRDQHVEAALRELIASDGLLTRNLLGFRIKE